MRDWLALVALLGLALAGCAERQRTNPLDPDNPSTAGSPAGFRAVAGNGTVNLLWTPLEVPDLAGYEVSRQGPGDPDFVVLAGSPLLPTTRSFADTTVTNETTYAYRLRFLLAGGGSGGTSETKARPGSAIVWVADVSRDALLRFTPDGRHVVLSLFGLNNPVDVAVDPSSGRVWGASGFEGFLAEWEFSGALVGVNAALGTPLGLAPLPGADRTWAVDARFGELVLAGADGLVHSRFAGFQTPVDVAFDPATLRIWLVDRDARRLVAYNILGAPVVDVTLDYPPWRVALDVPHAGLWISSAPAGVVEYRAADGTLRARADGLSQPLAISVDSGREEAWIVLAEGGALICLDATAQIVRRIGSLPEPRGVAFDVARDEIWVTTWGSKDDEGSLWHFQRDGALLQRARGLGRPTAVALDPARN